ncbi:MAG: hypothetical protein ACE5KF_08005 [Kiloniellaceae bacterium]
MFHRTLQEKRAVFLRRRIGSPQGFSNPFSGDRLFGRENLARNQIIAAMIAAPPPMARARFAPSAPKIFHVLFSVCLSRSFVTGTLKGCHSGARG